MEFLSININLHLIIFSSGIENCCHIQITIGWVVVVEEKHNTVLFVHNFSHVSTSPFSDLNTMGIYHIFIVSKSGGLIFNYDHKVFYNVVVNS